METTVKPWLPLLIGASVTAGCIDPVSDRAESTGAMLSVDYFGDTDVVGFHFNIERVACDAADAFTPFTVEANVNLVDGIFPGMIDLVEQTLDPDSRHLGADLFATLEAGCYDVMAPPAQEVSQDDFMPPVDCGTASIDGVEVRDGTTSEVTLISQCMGDENGALDTLVTLNHPPVVDVYFPTDDRDGDGYANDDDSKFAYECEPAEACV